MAPISGGWAALGPVAAADPVACSSQRPHSSLGAEGAIVWGWGVVRAVGGLDSEGKNVSGEVAPGAPVSRLPPDLHRDPFTTPALSPISSQQPSRFPQSGNCPTPPVLFQQTFSGAGSCPAPRVLTDFSLALIGQEGAQDFPGLRALLHPG